MASLDDADAYTGPAVLRIGDREFDVRTELRGHFEPIDGRYHWYGRLARHDALAEAIPAARASGTLTTPEGTASCELSEPDPWLRYRVTGISTPPFRTGMAMHAADLPPGQDELSDDDG
jgi:hypothetical protein